MESILGVLGMGATMASGGIFGFIGAITGAVAKHFQAQAAHKREIELRDWDMKMFDKQMAAKVQETENEIALVSAEGGWEGLNQSIQADASLAQHSGSIVNGVKSLFRPFLTTLLVIVTAYIFHVMWSSLTSSDGAILTIFTTDQIKDMLAYVIYSIVFSATTAVVWWFGDRALAPPGFKNR